MTSRFVRLNWRRAATAFYVLFAVTLISSSRAEASCGDYVMIGGDNSPDAHRESMQNSNPRTPAPGHPTCQGPHCSNNSLPPAAPGLRVDATAEEWAMSGGSLPIQLTATNAVGIESHEVPRSGLGLSILRPPR